MSQMKHMMDEVAARMGIQDPNDPRVQAEVERLLAEVEEKEGQPEVPQCQSR